MEKVEAELRARWQQMLERVRAGDDVPPALRLRAEGLMESLVLAGMRSPQELGTALADAWCEAMGEPLERSLGEDWQSVHPFPAIPYYMARAPVVASAGDDL